ncbi:MAG TPA: hypothetical protein DE179_00010 [Oceanospirillaceae bacterium]|nr:hypothetical protein [Oceanospirillaceae bacterium]
MTRPRCQLICLEHTPYYHVTSRCVRPSFLCGYDAKNNCDYEHRHSWIEARIRVLSSIFAMDICAYSVMSNHYHIVLKICPEEVSSWHDDEVRQRWLQLFEGPLLIQQHQAGKALNSGQLATVSSITRVWRERLGNLGWFMKCLYEPIARMANQEDGCSGHFWEARYKSQCLASEQALLSCMAYVDLNPVRACLADTPEASDYTSIKERVHPSFDAKLAIQQQLEHSTLLKFDGLIKPLMPFLGNINKHNQHLTGVPCSRENYLALVDWTGRVIRLDKRGSIKATEPPILQRLGMDSGQWLHQATAFEECHAKVFNREQGGAFIRAG